VAIRKSISCKGGVGTGWSIVQILIQLHIASRKFQAVNSFLKLVNSSDQTFLRSVRCCVCVFSISDFNWKERTLTFTAYSIDRYDSTEIAKLQIGDTILFRNDTIIVSKIEKGRYLTINGGIENGGVELAAYEGGTYRVQLMDDHPQYSELGKVQLPLSDTFTIIDCGDNPDDPYDTIRTNHKQRLENMKEYKHDFIELNTRVKIENGKITNITRNLIP
jgi:hypothetical protein